jgi:cell division protein FtsI (penicillin-binding protein 3)
MTTSEVQTAITGKRKWYMVAEDAKPATSFKAPGAIDEYNSTLPGMSP